MKTSGILPHQGTSDGWQKKKGGRDREGLGFTPARLSEQWPQNGERQLFILFRPSRWFENETHPFAVLFPAISNHLLER
jgi:hypothetical protein